MFLVFPYPPVSLPLPLTVGRGPTSPPTLCAVGNNRSEWAVVIAARLQVHGAGVELD